MDRLESLSDGIAMSSSPNQPDIPDDPGRHGVVAVCPREDGRMLVIRRARVVVAPLVYCFPGGGIEPTDASPEAALIRECLEELSIEIRPIRLIWQCTTKWKVRLDWYLAALPEGEFQLHPNPAEVDSIHWMTAEEMARCDALLDSNAEFLEMVIDGDIKLDW